MGKERMNWINYQLRQVSKDSYQEPIFKDNAEKLFLIVLFVTTLIVISPFLLTLSWCPDVEGLRVGDFPSTLFHAREVFQGKYPFWNHRDGIGLPHPYSTNLIYHPIIVALAIFPMGIGIQLFYIGHALLGTYSTWYLCRYLKIVRPVALVCVLTYLMSSPSLNYLMGMDFWPTSALIWTCLPMLLLLVCRFLNSTNKRELLSLVPAIAGLVGFMAINSHLGSFFYSISGISFFALASSRKIFQRWKYTFFILLLFVFIFGEKLYTVYSEFVRFDLTGDRPYQYLPVDLVAMFFWPLKSRLLEETYSNIHYRTFFIGFPFFALALISCVWPSRLFRFHRPIAISAVICLVFLFLPPTWLRFLTRANYLWRDSLVVFCIVLGGVITSMFFQKCGFLHAVALMFLGLQLVNLILGMAPFWSAGLRDGLAFFRDEPVKVLRTYLAKSPVLKIIERNGLAPGERIALSHSVESKLRYYSGFDYALFRTHQVPIINGLFKGISYDDIFPSYMIMYGTIDAKPFTEDKALLDILGVKYLIAFSDESVPEGLKLLKSLHSKEGMVAIYINPEAWPMARVLDISTSNKSSLNGTTDSALFYQDYSCLEKHVIPRAVLDISRSANKYNIKLAPLQEQSLLFINAYYRSPWKAIGHVVKERLPLKASRFFGGFIAVDLPKGTSYVELNYQPWPRIILTIVTWVSLIGCIVSYVFLSKRSSYSALDQVL